MTWFLTLFLALAAFLTLVFVLKVQRSGWAALGLALVLGLAGYGLQASPDLAGAPKFAPRQTAADPAGIVKDRNMFSESAMLPNNQWLIIADGLARNGQYGEAAQVLLGAVDEDRDNAEAWLAMANALVAHADGLLTPPALYAFRKAEAAGPENPGPPFFLGMALAQSGRFAEARALWAELLVRSEADAPWRDELRLRLRRLDEIMAARSRPPSRE